MFSISGSFFPTIPDYFKISEDYQSLTKMSEDYRRCLQTTEDARRLPEISKKKSENFGLHFCLYHIHTGKKYFLQVTDPNFFFRERNPCNSP